MEKFKYIFTLVFTIVKVSLVCLCYSSLGECKPSSDMIKIDEKRTQYEIEQNGAYSSKPNMYKEWPELNINEQLIKEKCKMYVEKLFLKKNFNQCNIRPSIKPIKLLHTTIIFNSLEKTKGKPVELNSLECQIDSSTKHRKYFHFIKGPMPDCVYLINRSGGNSYFKVSLKLCDYHTYSMLKQSGALEGAVYKQKQFGFRRASRNNDTTEEQEEYERTHQLWFNQEKRKRSSSDMIKIDEKRAEFDRELCRAYSSGNPDLYTQWPELKISELMNKEKCKLYIKKLFPKKNFEQCIITPSVKPVKFYHLENVFNSLEHLKYRPVILNSLECRIHPWARHRKYFHFLRGPTPDCVYLINCSGRNSQNISISLKVCENHTNEELKQKGALKEAVYKQKQFGTRRSSRNNDTIEEQKEYESTYQLWFNEVKPNTWPELVGVNQSIFCGKLLGKLYPKTTITLEDIEPLFYFEELGYIRLRNDVISVNQFEKIFVISCKLVPKIQRGHHKFIRAPNHGGLSCVFMLRAVKSKNTFQHIVKRLCVQKLYDNEEKETN